MTIFVLNFPTMSCKKECFEATISTCSSDIFLKAGLPAATEFYWVLIDRHNNVYQRKVTTDETGTLVLEATELPQGLNKYSGTLNLSIRQGADYLQLVELTFGSETYNCVQIHLEGYDRLENDDSEVNYIQYKEPA